MPQNAAENLAANIKRLRESRGLTQQELARVSDIPRPTIANLESGAANPTLSILVRIASALQVTIEDLIGSTRSSAVLYKGDSLPTRLRGGIMVRKLLPETIPATEIDRLELPAGAKTSSVTHLRGTREFIACESGGLEIVAGDERLELEPGDVAALPGDLPHSYANPGKRPAVAYSVVVLAPVGG